MVRYILALIVLIVHFGELTGCAITLPPLFTSANAVGGFFGLSGFVIYRSYQRNTDTLHYIGRRALRILPAYFGTVLFFAFALVLISSLSANMYFTSTHFWKYLIANLGFVNFVEPTLPGVFSNYELPAVNGSLWTMKVEWALYLSLPCVVALMRRFRWNVLSTCIVIYALSAVYRLFFTYLFNCTDKAMYNILSHQFLGQLMYFYSGVAIYLSFEWLQRRKIVWLVSGLLLLAVASINEYISIFLQPLGITLLVVWFSMIGKWATWEARYENLSYNIYLLHFPIIQLIIYFWGRGAENAGLKLGAAVVITMLSAWLLNRCVEQPVRRFFMSK